MEIGKRSTRGRRTVELDGEELEEDKLFWGDNVWKDDESDDSFEVEEEEEDKPDEFDSDFNDTEDDNDSDSGEDTTKEIQVMTCQVIRTS